MNRPPALTLLTICILVSFYDVFTPKTHTEETGTVKEPYSTANVKIGAEIFPSDEWKVSALLSEPTRRQTSGNGRQEAKIKTCKMTRTNVKKYYLLIIMLIAGDIHANPGPVWRYPCKICAKPVKSNQRGICCDECEMWTHVKCINMSTDEYEQFTRNETLSWACQDCFFPFSESLLESFTRGESTENISGDEREEIILSDDCSFTNESSAEVTFPELRENRKKYPKNLILSHVNINSMRNKYIALQEVLYDGLVDILSVQETKLDESFPDAQFGVPGYQMFRRDRNGNGGGIVTYVRSDIPARRRTELELTQGAEDISLEVNINNERWLMKFIYRPPSANLNAFKENLQEKLDFAYISYDNVNIIGDINIDMMDKTKSDTISDIYDIFDLKNIVKDFTCHVKDCRPSLVDVFLTNKPRMFYSVQNSDCGLSDCHDMISCIFRQRVPVTTQKYINYRSFKNLDEDKLKSDLENVPYHVAHVFQDIDDVYWAHEKMVNDIVNEHIPVKQKRQRKTKAPFMNGPLRRAINVKKALYRKFKRCNTSPNWEKFRKQRNHVTNLKRQSIRHYFAERCGGGMNSKYFWPTIKPFLTNKGSLVDTSQQVVENGKLITDPKEVAETFNQFFINVVKDVGENSDVDIDENHPSVNVIKQKVLEDREKFAFQKVDETKIKKYVMKIGAKKATGIDNLSPKILRLTKDVLAKPITNIVNYMIETGKFPSSLKLARVTPVHKKNDTMCKENYRPVSILPAISKVFERTISEQLEEYFDHVFNPLLSAYRRGYSCQSTLLAMIERWRRALDENEIAAAILMDLSKAFDCVNPVLLTEKLKAYGLDNKAVKLIECYMTNRKQCVRVTNSHSSFCDIIKGVPQGSILGPVIFNIYLNDIFLFTENATLYNYADDNSLSFCHKDLDIVKQTLERESSHLITWFEQNRLKANPEKFQAIVVSKKKNDESITFNIGDTNIRSEKCVKLLGVTVDSKLNFDSHIQNLCLKISRQINVLSRIAKYLTLEGRKTIYYSFIMSNFGFCPIIWHFCSTTNTKKLERLNYRALKFVYQDFTSNYEDLLREKHHSSLSLQRLRQIALETFKILKGTAPKYLADLISEANATYSQRHGKRLKVPRVRSTKYGLNSFRVVAANTWNSLPTHIRNTENYNTFKGLLQQWDGLNCKCAMCRI